MVNGQLVLKVEQRPSPIIHPSTSSTPAFFVESRADHDLIVSVAMNGACQRPRARQKLDLRARMLVYTNFTNVHFQYLLQVQYHRPAQQYSNFCRSCAFLCPRRYVYFIMMLLCRRVMFVLMFLGTSAAGKAPAKRLVGETFLREQETNDYWGRLLQQDMSMNAPAPTSCPDEDKPLNLVIIGNSFTGGTSVGRVCPR